MSHHHVTPTGCAPDRLAYASPETARKWGRRLYGARGYRLIQCGGAGAVNPPTPNPQAIKAAAGAPA